MIPFNKLARYEGNKNLFSLVLMSIVSSLAGQSLHIHAEGLRGTGKTSIMRAAQQILPKINRIRNCIYNCDPLRPHCPQHKHLSRKEIESIGIETITMPFLEISHSAKIGTVAGSIDLAKITDPNQAEAHLLPGLIPQAHRGIVFVDEINRLADTSPEITDILLDVMGNKPGHLQIEEAGMPVVDLEICVSLWAASNPDEDPGPLEETRRQLSDRFDMVCTMGRPDSVEVLAGILQENSYKNKIQKRKGTKEEEGNHRELEALRSKIAPWASIYAEAELPDFLANFIARLYIKNNLESIRAMEAMQQGAVLYSIIQNRDKVMINDVVATIPWVLKHRTDNDTLVRILNDAEVRGPKDTIMGFAQKLKGQSSPDLEYFPQNARSLKDMARNELINTEKNFSE